MSTSESKLTWYAIYFADGEPKDEQIAMKFKLNESKVDFRYAFQVSRDDLRCIKQDVLNKNADKIEANQEYMPVLAEGSQNHLELSQKDLSGMDLPENKNLITCDYLKCQDLPPWAQRSMDLILQIHDRKSLRQLIIPTKNI